METDSLLLGVSTLFKSEDIDQLQALIPHLNHIQDENVKSLSNSLASRIHLENLVERYWQRKLEKDKRRNEQEEHIEESADEEEGEEEGTRKEESLKELRLRIIEHPLYSTSPDAFRWPISTSQSATPQWSLVDEIMAILSNEMKKATRAVPATKTQADTLSASTQVQDDAHLQLAAQDGLTESSPPAAAADEDIEDVDDEDIDEMVSSNALPIIRHCQNSLQFLLDLLSNRIPIGKETGQKRMRRKDIITWRDVIKSIKSQSESSFVTVPNEVLQNVEDRMRSITGSQTTFPNAALMSNLGRDGTLSKLIRNQNPIPIHQSEKFLGLFANKDQINKRNSLQKRLREMDQDLFLSESNSTRSLLQLAPNEAFSHKRKRW